MGMRADGVLAVFALERGLAASGGMVEVERVEFIRLRRRDGEIGIGPAVPAQSQCHL